MTSLVMFERHVFAETGCIKLELGTAMDSETEGLFEFSRHESPGFTDGR